MDLKVKELDLKESKFKESTVQLKLEIKEFNELGFKMWRIPHQQRRSWRKR